LASFLIGVGLPLAVVAAYLLLRAEDQFVSTVGFSVRTEEAPSAIDMFGGFTGLSASSSSDTDILYSFIQSQDMVASIDADLDLREAYSRRHARDPVFGFDPSGSIEDLVSYWNRMARVSYDANSGLIELQVRAFDAKEAQAIAAAVFAKSSALINTLSDVARQDSTAYAKADLDDAAIALKSARAALTAFRAETQIVDPSADVQGQMGLLTTLQAQLAEEYIRGDLLRQQSQPSDPRIAQSDQRAAVIEQRIVEERKKLGGGGAGQDYASLVAEFERMAVDQEFAEQAYTAARGAYDLARAEARRQTRYLAAHIQPTLAERSTVPDPVAILGLTALFLTLGWSIIILVYYSVNDRK
jgi:capsular polysaccharide transport system permease protein